jgi:hypothetical protein
VTSPYPSLTLYSAKIQEVLDGFLSCPKGIPRTQRPP